MLWNLSRWILGGASIYIYTYDICIHTGCQHRLMVPLTVRALGASFARRGGAVVLGILRWLLGPQQRALLQTCVMHPNDPETPMYFLFGYDLFSYEGS